MNQYCLKGKILFDMGRLRESGDAFKLVVERWAPDDSYSYLGLANIAFMNAINCRSSNNEQDRLIGKAYNKYLNILAHD